MKRNLTISLAAFGLAAAMSAGGVAVAQNQGAQQAPTTTDQAPVPAAEQAQPAGQAMPADQALQEDATGRLQMTQKQISHVRPFLQELHAINQGEIKAGQTAQDKGQSQAVKDYGKTLVEDHKQLDQRVEDLAKRASIDLTAASPGRDVKKLESKLDKMAAKINKATPQKFDHEFAKQMEDGHKEALSLVKKAEKKIDVQDVKDLAQSAQPVLQKHLDMAKDILKGKATAH